MSTAVYITHADAAQAFELWENEFRATPEGFYTPEEAAAMEVASLAEGRAITFFAYLRQTPNGITSPTPVNTAGVVINLSIGQRVRHRDYQGKRVTGVVRLLTTDSDQGLMVEIGLDEPIVIPASETVREIKLYRQYAPAHEFQAFDERDELIEGLLAALQKADADFEQEGFGENGPHRASIRAAVAKANGPRT